MNQPLSMGMPMVVTASAQQPLPSVGVPAANPNTVGTSRVMGHAGRPCGAIPFGTASTGAGDCDVRMRFHADLSGGIDQECQEEQ